MFRYAVRRKCPLEELQPLTFNLDSQRQCKQFLQPKNSARSAERMKTTWMFKPNMGSMGAGLTLHNFTHFQQLGCSALEGAVQRYIPNPLLYKSRKFDLRSYVLIASLNPLVVFYKHGFMRVSLPKFNATSKDMRVHLVNSHVQQAKSDCEVLTHRVSPQQLAHELHRRGRVRSASAYADHLRKQMMHATQVVVLAIKSRLIALKDTFFVFGLDAMLDDDLRVHIIEINSMPASSPVSNFTAHLMQDAVTEVIDILGEVEVRRKQKLPLNDFCTPRTYELVLSEDRRKPYYVQPPNKCFN
eukprot:PLAT8340.2.p1 GENE.PLAT8340.2~~PLAT8340.2.p1  ORF type:complete len:300 (+),score=159.98 PLAT8340.2:223-1122(+)